jgi:hypothetical protein
MVCAGALLWAAAGCSLDSFLVSWSDPGGKPRYVAGSADQVSANLQAALGNAGVMLSETRDGRDVRLAGITRSGKRFTLVLRQQYADRGKRTAVAVEWEDAADEELWALVGEVLIPGRASKNTTAPPPAPADK